jgi:hypothetical protein
VDSSPVRNNSWPANYISHTARQLYLRSKRMTKPLSPPESEYKEQFTEDEVQEWFEDEDDIEPAGE